MRSRNWCFTLNNYTKEEYEYIKCVVCTYLVVGEEVGESGTPHLQGYIEFENARAMSGVKKVLANDRVHLEPRRGSSRQASDYCKKEGKVFEKGEITQQGSRSDLGELKQAVLDGLPYNTMLVDYFDLFCRYKNGIEALYDRMNLTKKRTEMTKGIWMYGPTGVGKSHRAFEMAGDDVYVWTDDNGWWDGYYGQKTVIINDFRGAIKFNELLQLVDKWQYSVRRRGKAPMPFTSEVVIVTSSLHPSSVYCNVLSHSDSINQLLRRFEVIQIKECQTLDIENIDIFED